MNSKHQNENHLRRNDNEQLKSHLLVQFNYHPNQSLLELTLWNKKINL